MKGGWLIGGVTNKLAAGKPAMKAKLGVIVAALASNKLAWLAWRGGSCWRASASNMAGQRIWLADGVRNLLAAWPANLASRNQSSWRRQKENGAGLGVGSLAIRHKIAGGCGGSMAAWRSCWRQLMASAMSSGENSSISSMKIISMAYQWRRPGSENGWQSIGGGEAKWRGNNSVISAAAASGGMANGIGNVAAAKIWRRQPIMARKQRRKRACRRGLPAS